MSDEPQWVEMRSVSAMGRASAVLDNLSQGLVVIDLETRELYWNEAARGLYGFAAELGGDVGRQWREFSALVVLDGLDGTPVPPTEWPIARLLRGEKLENTRLRARNLNTGWARLLRFSGARVEYAPGKTLAYLSIDELTEQPDAVTAPHIRELEQLRRFHAARTRVKQSISKVPSRDQLFREVCDALVVQGGFAMAWIGWHNRASLRLVPEAASGREPTELNGLEIYTDNRIEGRGPTGTAFREGRAEICNDVAEDPRAEFGRMGSQHRRFKATAAFPIRLGGETRGALTVYADEPDTFREREVALLDAVTEDISFALDNAERERERAQTQAAAQRELEFSASMIESLPGVFYFHDQQGRFLRWNRSLELLSGYRSDEIASMRPLDFVAIEDRARVAQAIDQVFIDGEATVEAGFLAKDGRVTPFSFTGRRVAGYPGPHLLGLGIDVADRKRAQDQVLQLNAELERRVAERTAQLHAANQELEALSDFSRLKR